MSKFFSARQNPLFLWEARPVNGINTKHFSLQHVAQSHCTDCSAKFIQSVEMERCLATLSLDIVTGPTPAPLSPDICLKPIRKPMKGLASGLCPYLE